MISIGEIITFDDKYIERLKMERGSFTVENFCISGKF